MRISLLGSEKRLCSKKQKDGNENGYSFIVALYILLALSIVLSAVMSTLSTRYTLARKKYDAFYTSLEKQNEVLEQRWGNETR